MPNSTSRLFSPVFVLFFCQNPTCINIYPLLYSRFFSNFYFCLCKTFHSTDPDSFVFSLIENQIVFLVPFLLSFKFYNILIHEFLSTLFHKRTGSPGLLDLRCWLPNMVMGDLEITHHFVLFLASQLLWSRFLLSCHYRLFQ